MLEETVHRGRSTMRAHRHAGPFLTVVVDGCYVEVCGVEPTRCGPGSIVVHDGAEEHADHFTADTRCLNIALPEGIDATILDRARVGDAARSVARAFYECQLDVPAALSAFDTALNVRPLDKPAVPSWYEAVVRDFAWSEPRPLCQAADLAGLHETHFSRAFHHLAGMTANEYRMRSRVRLASELLLSTSDSLARIALAAGFSDQSHFTRAYSRALGITPAAYRNAFAR